MNQCRFCGETAHYLVHSGPCPVLRREHEKRMELLEAQLSRARALALRAEQRVFGRPL